MLRTEWFKKLYIPLVFIFLKQARPVASKLFLKSQLSGRLTHRRMRRGGGGQGGSCPPKFGQNSGENSAKQEEKIGQRKLKD